MLKLILPVVNFILRFVMWSLSLINWGGGGGEMPCAKENVSGT